MHQYYLRCALLQNVPSAEMEILIHDERYVQICEADGRALVNDDGLMVFSRVSGR